MAVLQCTEQCLRYWLLFVAAGLLVATAFLDIPYDYTVADVNIDGLTIHISRSRRYLSEDGHMRRELIELTTNIDVFAKTGLYETAMDIKLPSIPCSRNSDCDQTDADNPDKCQGGSCAASDGTPRIYSCRNSGEKIKTGGRRMLRRLLDEDKDENINEPAMQCAQAFAALTLIFTGALLLLTMLDCFFTYYGEPEDKDGCCMRCTCGYKCSIFYKTVFSILVALITGVVIGMFISFLAYNQDNKNKMITPEGSSNLLCNMIGKGAGCFNDYGTDCVNNNYLIGKLADKLPKRGGLSTSVQADDTQYVYQPAGIAVLATGLLWVITFIVMLVLYTCKGFICCCCPTKGDDGKSEYYQLQFVVD